MNDISSESNVFPQKGKGFIFALTTLLISNIITVFLAFFYGFDIINILWIYWFQSVIIGVINVFEILSLKEFSTEGTKPQLKPNAFSSKLQIVILFTFVYGFFHLVYAIFLGVFFTLSINDYNIRWDMIIIGSTVFLLHYLIQFFSFSLKRNKTNIPNIGKVFTQPFYRIIPMHLIIILSVWIFLLGGNSSGKILSIIILLIFTTIKTAVDIIMQYFIFKKQ